MVTINSCECPMEEKNTISTKLEGGPRVRRESLMLSCIHINEVEVVARIEIYVEIDLSADPEGGVGDQRRYRIRSRIAERHLTDNDPLES